MICMRDLHTLPSPPDDAMVCVLKGYFDNSGDADDPQHKLLTVGGFLASEKQWAVFETRWQANLDKYKLPYLHMKEFAHFIPPFDIFRDNEPERISFLEGCISVLKECGIKEAVCHGIRLSDVRRFNSEYNHKIDAFSFCLYIAFIDIHERFGRDTHIELLIDRFSKITKKIYIAEEYARADEYYHHPAYNIATRSLSEDMSFKDVLPIQAADFLVWETCKSQHKYDEWFEPRDNARGEWIPDQLQWAFYKFGKIPYERQSLLALGKVCSIDQGVFATYKTLVGANDHHPNGWGDV